MSIVRRSSHHAKRGSHADSRQPSWALAAGVVTHEHHPHGGLESFEPDTFAAHVEWRPLQQSCILCPSGWQGNAGYHRAWSLDAEGNRPWQAHLLGLQARPAALGSGWPVLTGTGHTPSPCPEALLCTPQSPSIKRTLVEFARLGHAASHVVKLGGGDMCPVAVFLLQRTAFLLEAGTVQSHDTKERAWHAEDEAYLSGMWAFFPSSTSAALSAMVKAILGRAPARSSMLLRREAICSELDSKDFLASSASCLHHTESEPSASLCWHAAAASGLHARAPVTSLAWMICCTSGDLHCVWPWPSRVRYLKFWTQRGSRQRQAYSASCAKARLAPDPIQLL